MDGNEVALVEGIGVKAPTLEDEKDGELEGRETGVMMLVVDFTAGIVVKGLWITVAAGVIVVFGLGVDLAFTLWCGCLCCCCNVCCCG